METLIDYLPTTPDLNAERLADLRRLWPDLFTNDGAPDLAAVQAALGLATPSVERYAFTWNGKTPAKQAAFAPATATLVPDATRSFRADKGPHAIIEGENLQVLKVLLAGYRERVKCIYIDPPYNTGKDFVYSDNYTEDKLPYWEQTGGVQNGVRTDTNPDTSGRYHSDWLSMMYSRLLLARQLLQNDGVLLMSLDDNEMPNARKLLDEVFGEENFVANLIWEKGRKNDAKLFSTGHEYIFVYAKDKEHLKEVGTVWREEKAGAREIWTEYLRLKELYGSDYAKMEEDLAAFYQALPRTHPAKKHSRYGRIDSRGVWRDDNMSWPGGDGPTYDVEHPITKQPCQVPEGGWRYSTPEKMQERIDKGFVVFRDDHTEPPIRKTYLVRSDDLTELEEAEAENMDEVEENEGADIGIQVAGTYFYRSAIQATNKLVSIFEKKLFDNPKDDEVLQRLIKYVSGKDTSGIILDFFGGSGTTFHAVAALNAADGGNRQCILVQLPEQTKESSTAYKEGYRRISDLTIERCKRVVAGFGTDPQPLDTGFRVWRLEPSRFPAATFKPKKGQTPTEQVAELKQYLAAKQNVLQLPFMDDDQPARIAEILLKNGFSLNYTLSEQLPEYAHNRIVRVTDTETNATALLSLDDALAESTVQQMSHQPPTERLIVPERAFNTTAKWNLKMHLDDKLLAT